MKILDTIKRYKVKIGTMLMIGAMSCLTCISAFAAEGVPATPPDYSDVTTAVTNQLTGVVSSAKPMILAALGAGLGIFAIFMLFHLGKKALGAATSGK